MGSLLQVLLKCPLSVTQVLQESLLNSIQDETNIHSNTYSNFIITIFISISLKHQSYDTLPIQGSCRVSIIIVNRGKI